jgi:hypothetical protein
MTPAIAAGVEKSIWTVADLCGRFKERTEMRNRKFVIYINDRAVMCGSIKETIECLRDEIKNGNIVSDIRPADNLGGRVISAVDFLGLLKKAKIRLSVD